MCSGGECVRTISMTKPVKKGFLTRYKKRFIGSNWREEWIVLHQDSSLEWYSDHDESTMRGGITLKEAPEMIAAGPFASYVPGKPELPTDCEPNRLMVFGNKAKDATHWFIAANDDDLNEWMTAISNTLPPPPAPHQPQPSAPPAVSSNPHPPGAGAPPPYSQAAPTGNFRGTGQPGQYPHVQVPGVHGGGGRGGYSGGRGGYGGNGAGGYGVGGGGTNTVIIDRDRGGGGMGDFASGMMLGTAMGTGFGWGVPHYGMGFGGFGGWGFGMGFGVPMPSFGGGRGGTVENNETNIVNNYNTTNINNGEEAADSSGTTADPVPGAEAENINPDHGRVEEPGIGNTNGNSDGVDEGLLPPGAGAESDEGGLEHGLSPLDPSMQPGQGIGSNIPQESAAGNDIGFQEQFTMHDPLGHDAEPLPPADDYIMDYGDDGYDLMGGGTDLDMGGGYDVDLGGMDFEF